MFNLGFLSFLRAKKWPSRSQWRQVSRVLTGKEKIIFFCFLALSIGSLAFLTARFYFNNTRTQPARGGIYIEGVIGQPRFINPIYATSDVDRDLTELVFRGLMKYDNNLNVVPDLVKNYAVEDGGKTYKFILKDNLQWQDGEDLNADDVIFTIKTIQNPDLKSPLQANWVGVEIEKVNDRAFNFVLKKPYSAFLENCAIKILPKHIWTNIPPQNFPLEIYNLKPVGSGPYKVKEIKQNRSDHIQSLTLVSNPNSLKQPNIAQIKFLFFDDRKSLLASAKNKKIKGISSAPQDQKLGDNWQSYYLSFPRYFALFFNSDKAKIFDIKDIRVALNYATDKKEIISKVFGQKTEAAIAVDSPVLPEIYELDSPAKIYEFNLDKAKDILDKAGFKNDDQNGIRKKIIKKERAFEFKSDLRSGSQGTEAGELQKCLAKFPDVYPDGEITNYFGQKTKEAVIRFQEKYAKEILEPGGFKNGNGIISKTTRDKLNQVCFDSPEEVLPLRFSVVTVDQPEIMEVAELLKAQWKNIGVDLVVRGFDSSQLAQEFIKPRNYESLLFGEILGAWPDLFPFWHSSQKKDPGYNLSLYDNKKVDDLLQSIREAQDIDREKLATLQNLIIDDAPAVFLYCPSYIFTVSKEIKGVDGKKIAVPSKRFNNVEDWYIKTKRVWK